MKLLTYREKYHDIHIKWSIDEKETIKILDDAFERLIEELIDPTPWNLHKSLRDRRTNDEYLMDLIEGRLFEDLLVLWYKSRGHSAKRVGFDCDNKVIRSGWTKSNTQADLEVDGKLLEVQISRSGKRKNYHIKKYKGERILKGITVLQFITGDEYFMVGPEELGRAQLMKNPSFGGKECYEITNMEYQNFSNLDVLYDFNITKTPTDEDK